jgi:hypothetical protein
VGYVATVAGGEIGSDSRCAVAGAGLVELTSIVLTRHDVADTTSRASVAFAWGERLPSRFELGLGGM